MAEPSTRQVLERRLAAIRTKMRDCQPELMREMEALELALGNLTEEHRSDEFAPYKLGRDAVAAYLKKTGHTAFGETIANAVINGGWMRGHWRAKANLLQAIQFSAINNPEKKKQIKRFGGGNTSRSAEIGLYEWDDSHRMS